VLRLCRDATLTCHGTQEEVLKEAEACVVDAKRRLGCALQDLETVIDEHGEALAENTDMVEAKALLEANPAPEN
jgi:hypothetical protein